MVTTCTLNPSIDKTIVLETFSEACVNRAESVRRDAGGKGINVSLALSALNVPTHAVGLSFGGDGIIFSALERTGVGCDFISCGVSIRENTKIYVRTTGKTIEINEQNPEVTPDKIQNLTELLKARAEKYAGENIFVLSGSVPPGVKKSVYRELAAAIKCADPQAYIILDADGEALAEGIKASPDTVKPTVDELERAFGFRLTNPSDIFRAAKELISAYSLRSVIVSDGERGAYAVSKSVEIYVPALKIDAKSAQGAGDAMVAGACFAISKGMPLKDVLRCGTAAAAGAVELEGTAFCSENRFYELLKMTE